MGACSGDTCPGAVGQTAVACEVACVFPGRDKLLSLLSDSAGEGRLSPGKGVTDGGEAGDSFFLLPLLPGNAAAFPDWVYSELQQSVPHETGGAGLACTGLLKTVTTSSHAVVTCVCHVLN